MFSFETSARTGENIEELFIIASKILYNNFKDKIQQMVSPLLNLTQPIERRSPEETQKQEAEKAGRPEFTDGRRREKAQSLLQMM